MVRSISQLDYFERVDQKELYRFSEFQKILGPLRLSMYRVNNYPINLVYDYYMGRLIGHDKICGTKTNIMGLEFQVYEIERLKKMGVRDIEFEKDIITTKVDIYANIKNPIPFDYVNIDGTSSKIYLTGRHNFELKAGNIHRKAIEQVSKALA